MTCELEIASSPTFLGTGPGYWIHGTYTDEGVRDGHHGFQLPNGKWQSIQPDGSYEERDVPDGPYEWVTLDEAVNVLRVTPRIITYAIPVRER